MVHIDEDLLIAAGSERRCYAHPKLEDRCLKVPVKSRVAKKCPQCRVDLYCSRRLKAGAVPMRHAAKCYGWVETNMGPALMVEKIRDFDGKISLTLRQSLEAGCLTWPQTEAKLLFLKKWALEYSVVISELNVKNLMHRRQEKGGHLVVIDGLGGRKPNLVFYLRQHIPWMARHKTIKRWDREFNKVKTASLKIIEALDGN